MPTTLDEHTALSREFKKEWQESTATLAQLRQRTGERLASGVRFALGDALHWQDFWAGRLADRFGVRPPQWEPDHRLTPAELAEFVCAGYNFHYWQYVHRRIRTAVYSAGRREASWSAGWTTVCDICENQAEVLDGGLARLAAEFGVGISVPTATLAGFAAARLSLTKNQRLGKAISTLAKERGEKYGHVLLEELQPAVILALHDSTAGRSFLAAVAAAVEQSGGSRSVDALDENVESIAASEAAERAFSDAENSIQLEQFVEQAGLSKREAEYCALALEGIPQTEIAVRMRVAKGTVHSMASRVRSKLQAVAS